MDMGFTREHCIEALTNTTGLEQATEYILSHPPSILAPAAPSSDTPAPTVCLITLSRLKVT